MSGRLFQEGEHKAEKISAKVAPMVQNEIIGLLHKKHPEVYAFGIGSVGKKNDDDYNGDIDIAVVTNGIENLEFIIRDTFGDANVVNYKTLYIIAMNHRYVIGNEEKWVSVDFILSYNSDYTRFRYFCPNYRKGESRYKVGTKIMFANMILNHCMKEKTEGLKEGDAPIFNFTPIGLFKTVWHTKTGELEKYFISEDPGEITRMAFKTRGTDVFNSVETIWEAIHSDDFKYPEEVRKIEVNFFVNSYKKYWEEQVKPEDFDLADDVIDEINNKIKKESLLRKINQILDANV